MVPRAAWSSCRTSRSSSLKFVAPLGQRGVETHQRQDAAFDLPDRAHEFGPVDGDGGLHGVGSPAFGMGVTGFVAGSATGIFAIAAPMMRVRVVASGLAVDDPVVRRVQHAALRLLLRFEADALHLLPRQ